MSADQQAALTELLRRVGRRDEAALAELRQVTRIWLAWCIGRVLRDSWQAEEVLQDVYTYIWIHAAEYRGDRGTPAAWISMLARSRAVDRFRMNRRIPAAAEFQDTVRLSSATDGVDVWQNTRLAAALGDLAHSQRRLISFAFIEGMSHSEIAKKTRLPLGTVKTRIRTALARLREKLAAPDGLARAA